MKKRLLSIALVFMLALIPYSASAEEDVLFTDDFGGSALNPAWGNIYGKDYNELSLDTEQQALKFVMEDSDGQLGPARDFSTNEIGDWGGKRITISWKCRAEESGTGVRLNYTSEGNEANIFGGSNGEPILTDEWTECSAELEFTAFMARSSFNLMFKLPGSVTTVYFKDLVITGKPSDRDPDEEPEPFEWGNTGKTGKEIGDGNPLYTQRFGADPGWVEYDGRLYVYMTNDTPIYDGGGNIVDNHYGNIKHINVISSEDLMNWTDHGSIPVAGTGHVAPWASNSWAPSVAYKEIDGKDMFFLYFANSGNGVGVLRGESPIGPWEDPLGKNLVSHSTPNCGSSLVPWCFDPAVFIDDDGEAYLYFGGGVPGGRDADPGSARVVRLGGDMISIVGDPEEIYVPYFFEAADMVKRDGKYYFSYCSNWQGRASETTPGAAQIAYMTGDNPMGPFTYGGVILKNPGDMFGLMHNNNHQSIVNFKDKWYLLYHATLVSDAKGIRSLAGGQLNYRSAHINELVFLSDGTIAEVQGDRKGVAQLTTLNPYERVEAETIAWSSSIDTAMEDPTQTNSLNLCATNLKNGDWIAVAGADFGTEGAKSFSANVLGKAGGQIELRLGAASGLLAGTLNVDAGGGWQTLSTNVTDVTGVYDLYMVFTGGDGELFDFDWWSFGAAAVEEDGAGPSPERGDGPSTPAPDAETASEPSGGGGNGWIVWVAAAGAAVGVTAAVLLIRRRKS